MHQQPPSSYSMEEAMRIYGEIHRVPIASFLSPQTQQAMDTMLQGLNMMAERNKRTLLFSRTGPSMGMASKQPSDMSSSSSSSFSSYASSSNVPSTWDRRGNNHDMVTPSLKPRPRKGGGVREITNEDEWHDLVNVSSAPVVVSDPFQVFRGLINKLTLTNFEKITPQILEWMKGIHEEDQGKIIQNVIEIASTNRFFSEVYAHLVERLIEQKEEFRAACEAQLRNEWVHLFDHIEVGDADVNYEHFCDMNKLNEKRKAMAEFYANLVVREVLPVTTLQDTGHSLMVQLLAHLTQEGHNEYVDRICEVLFIWVEKMKSKKRGESPLLPEDTEQWIQLCTVKLKTNPYPSLGSKTLFKLSDMLVGGGGKKGK